MQAIQPDLSETLRKDGSGAELRRMQRTLRANRDGLLRQPGVSHPEAAARAFDAGIALLPELWRLEQRKR